jgi:hypothetical protein
LVVRDVNAGRVRVELVFTSETCLDCIVPNNMLVTIVSSAIIDSVPGVVEVEVLDPR